MFPRLVKTQDGKHAENISGSCVVLAMANIIGLSYENATKFALKHLPVDRVKTIDGTEHVSGIYTERDSFREGFQKLGRDIKRFSICIKSGKRANVKLDTIVKNLPKGRFMVIISGHGVAVIDNVICDNNHTLRTCRNGFVTGVHQVSERGGKIEAEEINCGKFKFVTFENYMNNY